MLRRRTADSRGHHGVFPRSSDYTEKPDIDHNTCFRQLKKQWIDHGIIKRL